MKYLSIFVFINTLLLACTHVNSTIEPEIYPQQFPGFNFSNKANQVVLLSDYEYQTLKGEVLNISNCRQANDIALSSIADFEYFRFKLLLLSCKAIDKHNTATASKRSYFPAKIQADFYNQLPADIVPLLSKADLSQRQGKSIASFYKDEKLNLESPNTTKLLTSEDEIFFTLLARGDFTNDGIEDLLIQSEWYARNAHGKHADLLILSRFQQNAPISIWWRLNALK